MSPRCRHRPALALLAFPARPSIAACSKKIRCATCIYRKDSPLDLSLLEKQVRDPHVGFKGYRICHHSTPPSAPVVTCSGRPSHSTARRMR